MNDTRVDELLDTLTPAYADRRGDWERVVVDAGIGTARRRARLAAVAVAAFAVAAVVLAWPFTSERPGLLERARAAIGTGPELHVILRGEWGGTLVDLTSGARQSIHGDEEVWFDTDSGRTHTIERLGDVVQSEDLGVPRKPAAELAALGTEYRQALASGTARVAGEDVLDGAPVVWVTIHSELLPDVADGRDHEWAQQVAVSKQTYEPVALRETRDGTPGPGTLQRVLELQMVPRADADFTASQPSRDGTAFRQGRAEISLDEAKSVLGRTPFWLGESYDGLALARVFRETTLVGHQRRVRVTGAKAAAAIACSEKRGAAGADCMRGLGFSPVEVRPDGVFTTEGPMHWSEPASAVVLVYGTVGDDTRSVSLTEELHASPFRRGVGSYVPPVGSVFVTAGGSAGYLQRDGIQIGIEAGNEDMIVAAARALTVRGG